MFFQNPTYEFDAEMSCYEAQRVISVQRTAPIHCVLAVELLFFKKTKVYTEALSQRCNYQTPQIEAG